MANWFENITKTLADEALPRRQAIRRISGTVAGIVLSLWLPEQAFASSNHQNHRCNNAGSCSGLGPGLCGVNKYNNCYCFQKLGFKYRGVCGCNSYCASIPACSSQSGCPSGYACITNTGCNCSGGVCVPKCTKTCQLASNQAGRTAASTI